VEPSHCQCHITSWDVNGSHCQCIYVQSLVSVNTITGSSRVGGCPRLSDALPSLFRLQDSYFFPFFSFLIVLLLTQGVTCPLTHLTYAVQVGANIKLPAWYLLDAISKNVPIPYAGLFAPVVADLFLDSYYQVDLTTRSKMEEMLMTWRDGGQHGREVFGVVPQVAIERSIWQSSSTSRAQVSRYFKIIRYCPRLLAGAST